MPYPVSFRAVAAVLVLCIGFAVGAQSAGDLAEGRALYIDQCDTCHGAILTDPDYTAWRARRSPLWPAMVPPYGPNLTGIIGREAGSVADYDYTAEFVTYVGGLIWAPESLDTWITDTQAVAPGSRMYYRQKDAEMRAKIIDYLAAFD